MMVPLYNFETGFKNNPTIISFCMNISRLVFLRISTCARVRASRGIIIIDQPLKDVNEVNFGREQDLGEIDGFGLGQGLIRFTATASLVTVVFVGFINVAL